MRVTYVLPYPELNGGNKVVAQHAHLLVVAGHQVNVLGAGQRPDWFPRSVPYAELGSGPGLPSQDLVVATFWTTIAVSQGLRVGPVAHFCQGFEGHLRHLEAWHPQIDAAYRQPLPALAVTPYLAELLSELFARPARVVPPPLDRTFHPQWRLGPRRRPRIVIPGTFEAEVKDTPTALAAVQILRSQGIEAEVARLSILPLSLAERRLLDPDLYLANVPPEIVAQVLRDADLLILPSRPGEGFGLPLIEAMASGVPTVASRIPSTEWIAGADPLAVALVPPGEPFAFAAAAAELLTDRRRWRRARASGLAAAERFAPEAVGIELEAAIRWATTVAPTLV
jgi:glycosyltransferase involved in cell wall biosynthesis